MDPRRVDNPTTANQVYFDLSLRHQIGVRRLSAGMVRKMIAVLSQADKELTASLRANLAELAGGRAGFDGLRLGVETKRIQKFLESLVRERSRLWTLIQEDTVKDLDQLIPYEQDFEERILVASVPVELSFARVSVEQLRASVYATPFAGPPGSARTLEGWFESLALSDQHRLTDVIRQGIVQGKRINTMVAEVSGTRAKGFTDGVLAQSRRAAETIVRTGVNHVSNAARESMWEKNSSIIGYLRWVSTLDGRTSAVCRARDGHLTPLGNKKVPQGYRALQPPGARPPAHPRCRSVMTAVIDIEGMVDAMGERPFVRDLRTNEKRQADFRAETKDRYSPAEWSSFNAEQRRNLINETKTDWATRNVGTVPASVDYDTWLRQQPASFQEATLGKKKAAIFRGGRHLDEFVDSAGRELTISQLIALGA